MASTLEQASNLHNQVQVSYVPTSPETAVPASVEAI
jgi:hypothetical protein